MKTLKKLGYIKVSPRIMIDALLSSDHKHKLLLVHINELNRIKNMDDRKKYISSSRIDYLTNLYRQVVLNSKTFKTEPIISSRKQVFSHIGMKMLHNYQQV